MVNDLLNVMKEEWDEINRLLKLKGENRENARRLLLWTTLFAFEVQTPEFLNLDEGDRKILFDMFKDIQANKKKENKK